MGGVVYTQDRDMRLNPKAPCKFVVAGAAAPGGRQGQLRADCRKLRRYSDRHTAGQRPTWLAPVAGIHPHAGTTCHTCTHTPAYARRRPPPPPCTPSPRPSPCAQVLRWLRFSAAFRYEMVLPLVALFFGTGNQVSTSTLPRTSSQRQLQCNAQSQQVKMQAAAACRCLAPPLSSPPADAACERRRHCARLPGP